MAHPLSRQLFKVRAKQRFTIGNDTYELGGKIGDGAAGVVRRARRLKGNESFAVKFLAPDPKYLEESSFR